jgi:hypothetical protein
MPAWVSSALRPPPQDRTVSVRFGGSIFFAGWFPWPGKWFHLLPGGGRQEIADPPLWFDKDAPDVTIEEEQRLVFGQEVTSAKPVLGPRQLGFDWTAGDSQELSSTRHEPQSAGRQS